MQAEGSAYLILLHRVHTPNQVCQYPPSGSILSQFSGLMNGDATCLKVSAYNVEPVSVGGPYRSFAASMMWVKIEDGQGRMLWGEAQDVSNLTLRTAARWWVEAVECDLGS